MFARPPTIPGVGSQAGRLFDARLNHLKSRYGPSILSIAPVLRVSDDDGRTVDAPRAGGLLADDLLGLELRAVVRELEPLAGLEHVLAEDAVVATGDRDRADVVEGRVVQRVAEADGVDRAADVALAVGLVAGGDVVDRAEVQEVIDALDLVALGLAQPEVGLGDVAGHLNDASAWCAEALDDRVHAFLRLRPHEDVDLALCARADAQARSDQ